MPEPASTLDDTPQAPILQSYEAIKAHAEAIKQQLITPAGNPMARKSSLLMSGRVARARPSGSAASTPRAPPSPAPPPLPSPSHPTLSPPMSPRKDANALAPFLQLAAAQSRAEGRGLSHCIAGRAAIFTIEVRDGQGCRVDEDVVRNHLRVCVQGVSRTQVDRLEKLRPATNSISSSGNLIPASITTTATTTTNGNNKQSGSDRYEVQYTIGTSDANMVNYKMEVKLGRSPLPGSPFKVASTLRPVPTLGPACTVQGGFPRLLQACTVCPELFALN